MSSAPSEETVLVGILIPISWGLAGEVFGISLMTDDERDYSIDRDSAEEHGVAGYLRKRVRLTAVTGSEGILRVIHIEAL